MTCEHEDEDDDEDEGAKAPFSLLVPSTSSNCYIFAWFTENLANIAKHQPQ